MGALLQVGTSDTRLPAPAEGVDSLTCHSTPQGRYKDVVPLHPTRPLVQGSYLALHPLTTSHRALLQIEIIAPFEPIKRPRVPSPILPPALFSESRLDLPSISAIEGLWVRLNKVQATLRDAESLMEPIAHYDTAQYARSVREDTAGLASYALSDQASTHNESPPRSRSGQTYLESHFAQGPEDGTAASRGVEGIQHEIIPELAEPQSSYSAPDQNPGSSVLTDMIRRSPPSTSPPNEVTNGHTTSARSKSGEQLDGSQGRLIIGSNGVLVDDMTERTPLLRRDPALDSHRPDWIRGEQDIESQTIRRKVSWPKIHSMVQWPKDKGVDIARHVLNPKRWDRKVIWQNAVVAPVGFLPAAVLGLLLNILDALSYGMSLHST